MALVVRLVGDSTLSGEEAFVGETAVWGRLEGLFFVGLGLR